MLLIAVLLVFVPEIPRASAEARIATGEIAVIDVDNRTVALKSGQVFRAGDKVKLSKRTPGDKVIIIYEAENGGLMATKIRRLPAELESFVRQIDPNPLAAEGTEVDE